LFGITGFDGSFGQKRCEALLQVFYIMLCQVKNLEASIRKLTSRGRMVQPPRFPIGDDGEEGLIVTVIVPELPLGMTQGSFQSAEGFDLDENSRFVGRQEERHINSGLVFIRKHRELKIHLSRIPDVPTESLKNSEHDANPDVFLISINSSRYLVADVFKHWFHLDVLMESVSPNVMRQL
jgi:hypothetical protein